MTLHSKSACVVILISLLALAASAQPQWEHLSSKTDPAVLPVPSNTDQQTAAVVGDLDGDKVNDFVLAFREKGPALVWYRRTKTGWERKVIEPQTLHLEAGGALYDIDGDGDLDLVFGNDYHGTDVWWWENPAPNFDKPWQRHLIKTGGGKQHHDQVFGDFLGTGRAQLAFWNQGAKKLLLAEIPPDVRNAKSWPITEIFDLAKAAAPAGGGDKPSTPYAEGIWAADIDGDGKVDLVAGNYWFKHMGGKTFKAIRVCDYGGRVVVGKLVESTKYPQIVISSGDGVGPLLWLECIGADPQDPAAWTRHELLPKMIHGHSLQVADIDGDGHLDIFAAEMAKWHERQKEPDNPQAKAWIFYGDGKGGFRPEIFATGIGFHEARVADLDGDGRMDILDKPYNWEVPRVDVWLQKAPPKN